MLEAQASSDQGDCRHLACSWVALWRCTAQGADQAKLSAWALLPFIAQPSEREVRSHLQLITLPKWHVFEFLLFSFQQCHFSSLSLVFCAYSREVADNVWVKGNPSRWPVRKSWKGWVAPTWLKLSLESGTLDPFVSPAFGPSSREKEKFHSVFCSWTWTFLCIWISLNGHRLPFYKMYQDLWICINSGTIVLSVET